MKPSDYSLKRNWRGYLLVVPACIAIFLVSIYPMLYGISLAFQNYTLTKANSDDFRTFAGLKNFIEIFKQSEYIQACQNTLFWTLTNVIVQVVLAVLIALALNRKIKGRGFFRTTALIPWAVPSVIAALTFRFLYDANVGIINAVLKKLGILADGISWLGNLETARWAVVIESIWKGTPFVMIFVLAALQSVPHEMYESARVDGAGGVKTFFKITLPMIKETLGIATILTTIGTINNFNAVWLMTQGGPRNSSNLLVYWIYETGYLHFNVGKAMAGGVMLLLFIGVISIANFSVMNKRAHYQ